MIDISITDQVSLIAFWLIFTRLVTIFFQLPIFDDKSVPGLVKVLTCLVMSYAFFPFLKSTVIADIRSVGEENFWLLTVSYSVIGLLIGFMVKIIMTVYTSAGALISQQMGFAAMRYFDPTVSQAVGPFEIIIRWSVTVIVLTSGALFPMFRGVFESFFTVQASSLGQLAQSPAFFVEMTKSLFMSGLLLSTPLIFANLIIMSVLGIIARTVPQMNVLMVSFVVNIGTGLLVFFMTSGEFFEMAFKVYTEKLAIWFKYIT